MLLAEPFRRIRLAARSLLASPAFTITVVLTLALGIGANTAVFSAIDAVLLKPLPYPEADQLTLIQQHHPVRPDTVVAPVRLLDWSRENTTFQSITGYYAQDASELSSELPERVKQAYVGPRFLETLRISPALGRDFTSDEQRFGGPNAALISDRLWRRRFGGDPSAVGKQLRFGQTAHTIVGVMPASFLFSDREVDVWSPVFMDAPFAQSRFNTWFNVVGRLKPGVTAQQANANLTAIQAQLGRQHGRPDSELSVTVQPLKDVAVGPVSQSLWLVFGAVSLLLLIACTNIAALLLTRATQRDHEVAVRFALGASRLSIAMQLLTEAFVLSLTGAVAGLAVATGLSRFIRAYAGTMPRLDEIAIDSRILLYTLACAVIVTALCGLIPALRGSRRDPRSGLAHSGRTQVSSRNPLQWTLVGVQVALAVALLTGAGLMLRSFQALGQVDPGFDTANVLTFRITSSWAEDPNWATRTREFLETVPGVSRAATVYAIPGVPSEYPVEFAIEGRDPATEKIVANTRGVSEGYFDLLQIPLLKGERCRQLNNNSPYIEGMVNRSFAETYFPGTDPIGRSVRPADPAARPIRVQGVVADSRDAGIDKDPAPLLYTCAATGIPLASFMVRTRTDPAAMTETIRAELRKIEPSRSAYDLVPIEARVSDAFSQDRLRTILLTFFAVTAVSLACVGLYGTLSYFVSLRRREVGLRLALGAGRGRIVRQFFSRGMAVAALGCIAGIALALAFAWVLAGMLFGVTPSDPATLAGVVAIMCGVAGLASLLPSLRAAVVEPMQVLRDE